MMDRKKIICVVTIVLMAAGLAVMVGCGNKQPEPEPTTEAPTTTTEATTTTEPTTEKEVTYQDLYNEKLDALVDEYGSFNGRLMDMDSDDIPEMIIFSGSAPNLDAEIYTVKDDEVVLIYEKTVNDVRYGQTDASYQVWINESISPSAVVLFNSEDEWVNEEVYAVTVSGGSASEKVLKANTDGENDDPDRSWLGDFTIDGSEVSSEDYNSEYDQLQTGAETIDPFVSDVDSLRSALEE